MTTTGHAGHAAAATGSAAVPALGDIARDHPRWH
jgi:hypothetical protein